MQSSNRVVWTEGMFLRVQHFQQADRWTEALVHAAVRDIEPHRWGVADMTIDRDMLNIGKFALASCRGTMPDGTPFSIPDETDPPPPLELTGGERGATVFLALPLRQQGAFETGTDRREDAGTRYRRSLYEAPDANSGSFANASLELGRSRLSYLLSGAPTAGYALLAVAVIVEMRPDLSVTLDEKFIAPCLNCATQPLIVGFLTELQGLVTHRAEAIAARMADPSVRGTAEVADFMLLQSMNRAEPLLRHLLSAAATLHPEAFYRHCIVLAGELATYTAQSKRAAVFPPYRHDALYATFAPVFADLRASLSSVLEQTAVMIPLADRRHGVRVGMIADRSLLLGATFVLSVHADVPAEQLRRMFPNQMKIGPVEQIAQLVNIALPGIPLRALPVAPRQLPYRSGSVYFELERGGPIWKQLANSGAIALHLAGSFPQIEMELWAIKD
jgi:type VI secretion system protein ImpJ